MMMTTVGENVTS